MASVNLELLLEHDCIFNWTTSNFPELVFVEPNTFIDKFSLLMIGSFSCSFTSFVTQLFWERLSNKTLLCPFDVELTYETKTCDLWNEAFFCAWEFSANRVVVVLFPIFSFWIRFSTNEITWFILASSVSCSGVCWGIPFGGTFFGGFLELFDFGFWIFESQIKIWCLPWQICHFWGLVQFLTTCPTRKQIKHLVLLIRVCFRACISITIEHLLLGWFCLQ